MFRRSAWSLVLTALTLLLVAASASASAARTSRIWFPLDRLPLAHADKLGAAKPSQTMDIGIGLKDPHAAAEQALMTAQQNPSSSQYDHFLTPAQYDSRFAVGDTTFDRTLSWLRGGGAHILDTSGARDFVEISATVSQIDKLFDTSIGSYEAKGVRFLANADAPSVPAGLDVLTVMGLNTLIHPTTPLTGARAGDRAPGSTLLGKATDPAALKSIPGEGPLVAGIASKLGAAGILGRAGGGQVTVPVAGPVTVPGTGLSSPAAGVPTIPAELTPQQLWSVYDMPSDNLGQGQSVAVMGSGDSSTTVKDLAVFESEHKLPKVPVKVTDIPADGDFSDTSGNVEWELDTQSSTGMAPDVKQVHLYFAEHLIDPDAEADFAKWVDDPSGPKQANASFGECETTPANATLESTIPTQFNNNEDQNALYGTGAPDALEPVADQTLRQGVLEGRTLFAATGDTGSSCPVLVLGPELGAGNGVANQGVPIVNYPAASPYVVAVGGTVLYPDSDNARGLEYPWPYTGGGQSYFIPAPSWQSGVSNINRPCLSSVSGAPNTSLGTCRGIPDVADESGDIATSSYDIYSDELGGASSEGGTSLASPLMMGMWTRVQAASRRGTGFADPLIYAVGKNSAQDAAAFNDYSVGTNGAYQAQPGWDYVSGWGTPVLTPLMKDIDNGNTAPIH
jgi:subtilase family serine protease